MRGLTTMDEPTLKLTLELLERDMLEEADNSKGKQKAGTLTDRQLALKVWSDQLHQYVTELQDHKMACSVARAVLEDGVALTIAAQEESRAYADRRLAFRLAGEQEPAQETPLKFVESNVPGDIIYEFGELEESLAPSGSTKEHCPAESSKEAAYRYCVPEAPFECVACGDARPAFDMLQAQCSHWYCKDCIIHLVKDSIKDQSLFPPKCCRTPISLSAMRKFLGVELTGRFEEKEIENKDPFRTYCSNPQCAEYILPTLVDGYLGTCIKCQSKTCTLCKQSAHEGPCVDNHDEVLKLAKEFGWQRCSQCQHIIELRSGCNHITAGMKLDCMNEPRKLLLDMDKALLQQGPYSKWLSISEKEKIVITWVSGSRLGGVFDASIVITGFHIS